MEFRILGPVELWWQGQRLDAVVARERHILAILLMGLGRPVSVETLGNRIWDNNPPDNATDSIHQSVSRLRKRIRAAGAPSTIVRKPGGYVLQADPDSVDHHRCLGLLNRARATAEAGDDEGAAELYRRARALWRGEPLAEIPGTWAEYTRSAMVGELLKGVVGQVELELRLGRHAEVASELPELIERYPFEEKLIELLMIALYRSGRTGDALAVHRRESRRLVRELGPGGGRSLDDLSRRILRSDPSLLDTPPPERDRPRNTLPRDLATFTGRAAELTRLTAACAGRGSAVPVLFIDGMAGVGKTTLALHLAHRLAPRYPDAQLFLDLHGHDPGHRPLDPATALDRLLRALGVHSSAIPHGVEERAALWRAELASRRIMLVLDDATGREQVRHLLPGGPGSLVVITSRTRPAGLDDIESLSLEVMPPHDAATLLTLSAGPHHAHQAQAVASVVRLCGYLPLAIQIAGARLQQRPAWTAEDLATTLRGATSPLAELRVGDRAVSMAFDLSYRDLDESDRRAFRLLGLYPGRELSVPAAAALLGLPRRPAERFLERLVDNHLVRQPRRGRYRFHDLIGEYAARLAEAEPEEVRTDALRRLLGHFLTTADRADRLQYPDRPRPPIDAASDAAPPATLATAKAAGEWLRAEFDDLLRIARFAADRRQPRHTALFSHVLSRHLEEQGHWAEAALLHENAVRAWRELGDAGGTAQTLADLAQVRWRMGRLEEALQHAEEALIIRRSLSDPHGVAAVLDQIGQIHWHRSEYDLALVYYREALEVRTDLGDRRGVAEVLNHMAIVLWHRNDYSGASERWHTALALYREIGDTYGEQITLNNLGDFEFSLHRHEEALRYYQDAVAARPDMKRQHMAVWLNNVASVFVATNRLNDALDHYLRSVAIYQEIGDRRGEAETLVNIGSCLAELGRDAEAQTHYEQGLRIAQDMAERYVEMLATSGIGAVHHRAGRPDQALGYFSEYLELARSIGDERHQALALKAMAEVAEASGGPALAEGYRRQAREIRERLGLPPDDAPVGDA